MKRCFLFLFLDALSFCGSGLAQTPAPLEQVCPVFWWTGMKNPFLQLMIHGTEIGGATVSLHYPGVTLRKVHRVENKNYLFLDLWISKDAKPGKIPVRFGVRGQKPFTWYYELKGRGGNDGRRITGVGAGDLIYLLMPDRFSNGDTSNDRVPGMLDQTLNRDSMYYRHGGDLQGILNHLDYFNTLGVTALWLNPVIENDEAQASYHGYAFTDHYRVDPRLGTNTLYVRLVQEAHAHRLKIIQDIVLNHVGEQHWFVKDLPMKNWLNEWPQYTNTSFRDAPLMDPHGSQYDKKIMTDGWFTPFMPDLNQRNPYVANFLIENSIWWVEYAGIDGYRIDTYPYCDPGFMNRWNDALLEEFPRLCIFGETWVHGVLNQAYFTRNRLNIPFHSHLPGATDFQLYFAVNDALTQPFGWTAGVNRLYQTLAGDFVYEDASRNVVFLDNHDTDRFLSKMGESIPRFLSGFTWLLTTRGIPQMYYGDEILMKNFARPDGKVRADFPGGWPADTVSKFTAAGRTPMENKVFDYISRLAHYRQHSTALRSGRLMQFAPEKGVYVYFRYDDQSTVMVLMNGNDREVTVPCKRFSERMKNFREAKNVMTGEQLDDLEKIKVPPDTTIVLELLP